MRLQKVQYRSGWHGPIRGNAGRLRIAGARMGRHATEGLPLSWPGYVVGVWNPIGVLRALEVRAGRLPHPQPVYP